MFCWLKIKLNSRKVFYSENVLRKRQSYLKGSVRMDGDWTELFRMEGGQVCMLGLSM